MSSDSPQPITGTKPDDEVIAYVGDDHWEVWRREAPDGAPLYALRYPGATDDAPGEWKTHWGPLSSLEDAASAFDYRARMLRSAARKATSWERR